jgi:DNA-binding NarL/FixJ family response regulator
VKILIVDDHAIVRDGLSRLLATDADHELRMAATGRDALILVLSMHAEPLYARRALEAGAQGYVSKNAAPDELLAAVRRVAAGGRYIEAEIAQALALGAGAETLNTLSPRELEIMRLLAAGSSLAEIADALGASYKTIANTCTLIKSKLGVARTADLVRLAIETGVS